MPAVVELFVLSTYVRLDCTRRFGSQTDNFWMLTLAVHFSCGRYGLVVWPMWLWPIWYRPVSKAPYKSLDAVSYSPFIALSCITSEIKPDICRKSWFFHTPLAFYAPVRGVSVGISAPLWYGKTRVVSLPVGNKISKMCLFILTWFMNVTDGQTDGQTDRRCMTAKTALASHRAVKTKNNGC